MNVTKGVCDMRRLPGAWSACGNQAHGKKRAACGRTRYLQLDIGIHPRCDACCVGSDRRIDEFVQRKNNEPGRRSLDAVMLRVSGMAGYAQGSIVDDAGTKSATT